MARIAESSVVIAFRDWQWLHRIADAKVPPLMIVMDGKPETKLGDLQISASDRFFLLEVKSTHRTIREEWSKKTDSGNPNPKELFKRLSAVLDAAGRCYDAQGRVVDPAGLEEQREIIYTSIAGHHLLYWDEKLSDFRIEPYLLGCKQKNAFEESRLEAAGIAIEGREYALNILKEHLIGLSQSSLSLPHSLPIDFGQIPFINPIMLHDKSARLISNVNNSPNYLWDFFGLEFGKFQEYVEELCHGEAYQTNCILINSSGQFFAHIVDTSDLLSLVKAIAPHMVPSTPSPPMQTPTPRTSKAQRKTTAPPPKPDPSPKRKNQYGFG